MKAIHALLALTLIGVTTSVRAQLQSGYLPPGNYNTPGSFTAPNGGPTIHYNSFTVSNKGTITFNLVGGGKFIFTPMRPSGGIIDPKN